MGESEFPIDMVYLWCDGNEPEFFQRKATYMEKEDKSNKSEAFGEVRFFDNEELRYSLRSLEMYAPWIHHIFIVTDRQIPHWLDLNNTKISIVDHSEIMPKNIIPCFNSSVIERYIGFIPGLQEHFLYGNDDTFLGEKVSKDFFFTQGKPIVRVKYFRNRKRYYTYEQLKNLEDIDFFGKSIKNAWMLLAKQNNLKKIPFLEPHHNIDAFTKSAYQDIFFKYQNVLEKNIYRFRNIKDIQRLLFCIDPVINETAELRMIQNYSKVKKYLFWLKRLNPESYYSDAKCKSLLGLWCIHPILFCINGSGISLLGNKIEKLFLKWKFPNKSSFEK